jgi:hypothetical protein
MGVRLQSGQEADMSRTDMTDTDGFLTFEICIPTPENGNSDSSRTTLEEFMTALYLIRWM